MDTLLQHNNLRLFKHLIFLVMIPNLWHGSKRQGVDLDAGKSITPFNESKLKGRTMGGGGGGGNLVGFVDTFEMFFTIFHVLPINPPFTLYPKIFTVFFYKLQMTVSLL